MQWLLLVLSWAYRHRYFIVFWLLLFVLFNFVWPSGPVAP